MSAAAEVSIPYYRLALESALKRKRQRRPRYSLRAFARDVRLDAGFLSAVLGGKKSLSLESGAFLAARLALPPEERELFLHSIAEEHKARGLERAGSGLNHLRETMRPVLLENDLYEVMRGWHYPALLDLSAVDGFRAEPEWVARALGISPETALDALNRLTRVGLLKMEDGRLVKSEPHVTTRDKSCTTQALINLQREVLKKTIEALENFAPSDRLVSSMTMAIDPEKFDLARSMIEAFTHQLCKVLESGRRRQVFQLGINLFPLQEKDTVN